MARKHQGWEATNDGTPQWERLEYLADGTRTVSGIADILNAEYGTEKTAGAVRKKIRRMDLDYRRKEDTESPSKPVSVHTEPRTYSGRDLGVKKNTVALVVNDAQAPYHDPDIINLVIKVANEQIHPDEVHINGDFFDFYPISKYSKKRERKIQWNLYAEVKEALHVKEAFENIKTNKRAFFHEGNHEFRLERYIMDRAPELYAFPALQAHRLLQVDKRNYFDYTDPNRFFRNNLMITHGDIIRKHSGYTAKAMIEKYGVSVVHGHCHRGGSHTKRVYGGQLKGQENFCLCDLNPEYGTSFPNWQQGFSIVYFSGNQKRFHIEPVPISGGGLMLHGRRWHVDDLTKEDMVVG